MNLTPIGSIAVEGPPKSGKRILAELLARKSGGRLVEDVRENPYLESFLRKPEDERAPILTQLVFLVQRGLTLLSLNQKSLLPGPVFTDFLLERDKLYALQFLKDDEFYLYDRLYALMEKNTRRPDRVCFLQLSTPELLKRVELYGTPSEKRVSQSLWGALNEAFQYFVFHYQGTPSLVVKADNLDFRKGNLGVDEIWRELRNMDGRKQFFFLEEGRKE